MGCAQRQKGRSETRGSDWRTHGGLATLGTIAASEFFDTLLARIAFIWRFSLGPAPLLSSFPSTSARPYALAFERWATLLLGEHGETVAGPRVPGHPTTLTQTRRDPEIHKVLEQPKRTVMLLATTVAIKATDLGPIRTPCISSWTR
jgi:hypothetical protein